MTNHPRISMDREAAAVRIDIATSGPAGFPSDAPRITGAVPLSAWLYRVTSDRAGLPLSAHSNPRSTSSARANSLGAFLESYRTFLASLASPVSDPLPSRSSVSGHPPTSRKAGYTAHSFSRNAGSPQAVMMLRWQSPRTWVSAGVGSRPHAIADCPIPLNSQHQPPTGRRQPAPGTS